MVASSFYEKIGLSQKVTSINKKLDKKMFYDYVDINRKEKNVIMKFVERMELTYLLTPNTINIQAFINEEYHYEGVMFVTIQLRNNPTDKQVNILEEIIHGSLPNPVLILFIQNEQILLSSCMKRLNKVNKNEVVLGEIHHTEWFSVNSHDEMIIEFIGSIEISNLSFNNFFEFYKEIDIAVKAFQVGNIVGRFKVIKNDEERKQQEKLVEQIKTLEQKYKSIITSIKRETQFNKKVEMNIEAQKIKQQIDKLKVSITKE